MRQYYGVILSVKSQCTKETAKRNRRCFHFHRYDNKEKEKWTKENTKAIVHVVKSNVRTNLSTKPLRDTEIN